MKLNSISGKVLETISKLLLYSFFVPYDVDKFISSLELELDETGKLAFTPDCMKAIKVQEQQISTSGKTFFVDFMKSMMNPSVSNSVDVSEKK